MPTPDDTPVPSPDITLTTGTAPPNPDGEWLTVSEAVARTGRAERTIRRWIDDGSIEHKRQAGRVLVWVPSPAAAPDVAVTQQLALLDRQEAMLQRLTDRQAELARQQAEQQAERQAPLLAMLDARDAQIVALVDENARLRAELEQARKRPWWRFW